jgi:hypothetical protein
VTAFVSRTQDAFRRRVASLAVDSVVWFLTEPDCVLEIRRLSKLCSDAQ